MSPLTFGVVSLLLVAIIVIVVAASLSAPATRADRISRRAGLALPDAPLRERILERARTTRLLVTWGGAMGGLITLTALVIAVTTGAIPDPQAATGWVAVAGIMLGTTAGALLRVLAAAPQRDPDQPRVAHARHRSARDYLHPIERIGARVATGAGIVAAIAVVLTPGAFSGDSAASAVSTVALAAAAAIGLTGLEWGGARIVLSRPRTATSPADLAWDDALRADDLRTLASAPIMTGTYAATVSIQALASALPYGTDDVLILALTNGGFFVLVIALVVVLAFALAVQPEKHYLRRLWPDVAARSHAPGSAG